MKTRIKAPLAITIVALELVAVAFFGWMELRIPMPNVSPEQTKAAIARQMKDMKEAAMQVRAQSSREAR